jgi:hypothetical protein
MPVSRISAEADSAEQVVPGEAVQRCGAAERRVPHQGCEHVGDRATGIRNGETATRGGLQAARCGNRIQRLGHGGEIPPQS